MPKITDRLADKLTPALLKSLSDRSLRKKDLAEQLGVTATHLSRTLTAANFKRVPAPDYAIRKAAALLYRARGDNRLVIAQKVADKLLSIETACKLAVCSERTMRRYLAKLLLTEGLHA